MFDELLRVQLALVLRKRELERTTPGIAHDRRRRRWSTRFHDAAAVRRSPAPSARSIAEIDGRPGRRRTRCTGCCRATSAPARRWWRCAALLTAVQGGHQGAFMAPTEVLAEQHHLGIRALLDGFTVPDGDEVDLFGEPARLARRAAHQPHAGRERRRLLAGLADGRGRPR